jgi:hypothetical protein
MEPDGLLRSSQQPFAESHESIPQSHNLFIYHPLWKDFLRLYLPNMSSNQSFRQKTTAVFLAYLLRTTCLTHLFLRHMVTLIKYCDEH